jgi:hypothetical protein
MRKEKQMSVKLGPIEPTGKKIDMPMAYFYPYRDVRKWKPFLSSTWPGCISKWASNPQVGRY